MTYDCKDCKYNAFTWCIIRSPKSVPCDDCPMWKSDAPFGQKCKCLQHSFNNDRNREPCKYYVKLEEDDNV